MSKTAAQLWEENPYGYPFVSIGQIEDRNKSLRKLGMELPFMDFEEFFYLEEYRDWDEAFARV